jgi:tRNA A-37 threonylcarbamoyl transferase component Bud32
MVIDSMIGRILGGRYEIQSLIGQGGMAAVYKGYDPNLRRTIAVKIIHQHLSTEGDFTRRFEAEATAVARLRHPNIIQVFDFNHDGNVHFMVMEFLAGETLQTRLERLNGARRKMPVDDALHFAAEICDAADYAHQRGLVHRDIKPSNIMLDVHGKAILMDFGIARMVSNFQHTASNAVVGTALYMAPEQIQGIAADARADIYSIGVTLYEMLSGRPPFESNSAMTLMMMHLNDPAPDIRQFQPDTPLQVKDFIDKALEKNRDARFPSAAAMATALRGVSGAAPGAPLSTAAANVAPASAALSPVPAASDATYIEAAKAVAAGATLIEASKPVYPAGNVAPSYRPAPVPASQTMIDQPYQPARSGSGAAASFPASPDQAAYPVEKKRGKAWIFALLALVVLLVIGGFFLYRRFFQPAPTSSSPEAALVAMDTPTATVNPTLLALLTPELQPPAAALLQPTSTETPLPSATPTPKPVIIGGADKIAWINASDIWVANLDGSGLVQLTTNGGLKTNLRWLPGGQGLSYIMGKCIRTISLSGEDQVVTCFNNAKYLTGFEVSPDGSQVAISLDNQLYLLPFNLDMLKDAKTHGDLANLAVCKELAPYKRNFGRDVRWSADSKQWAALVLGVLKSGQAGDLIQVFPVDRCIPNPRVTAQFPEPHFTYPSYQANPSLENYDWDGASLFVMNDFKRNSGFGDLHIFNMEKFQPILGINPVGTCCYRDASWSPDGSHLAVAFQNYLQGSNSTTELYLIPYGDIGTGATFNPLPLPAISDAKESPQPVLRPALTP